MELSEEKLNEIWAGVRKFWFHTRLPKPEIVEDPKAYAEKPGIDPVTKHTLLNKKYAPPEFLSYLENRLYLNVPEMHKYLMIKDESELEKAIEVLELHGVGHHALICHDILTKLLLCHSSAKALQSQNVAEGVQSYKIGGNLAGLFEDIVDNTYIVKHGGEKGMPQNKENVCFIYDRFKEKRECDPKMKELPRKTWDVYMRVCEKLWNEDGRWTKDARISKDQEEAAESIYRTLKDDIYNSRNWEKRMFRVTQLISPFVIEDGQQGNDVKMFENESSGDLNRLNKMIQELEDMKNGKSGKEKKKDKKKGKNDKDKDKDKGKCKKDEQKELENKIQQMEEDIQQELKGLAKKLDKGNNNPLQDYKELLAGSGINANEEKANKWYYRDLASNYAVKFRPVFTAAGRSHPFTPKRWGPSDPVKELDMPYTLLTSGKAIPGITTTRWRYKETVGFKEGERPPDLYMIIDSSGSMTNPKRSLSYAVLGAEAAAQSARNTGVKVAAKNFSGKDETTGKRDTTTIEETANIDEVEDVLMVYKGGGTVLPQEDIIPWIKNPETPKQFLLITDTHFHNFDSAFPYLKQALEINPKNRGSIFCIGSGDQNHIQQLEGAGWEVFYVKSAQDLFGLVVGKAKEVYQDREDIL